MKNILFLCLLPLLGLGQTQIGASINGEAVGDMSGNSVSISADGNIVAIGAPFNDSNGVDSGQVRIYKNNTGTWSQIGTDINGVAKGDYSGWSVSLSADGNTVAIGVPYNDGNGIDSGKVCIYINNEGSWTQIGTDINGEVAGDYSGYSVSLSADGTIVAIGLAGNDGNGVECGLVRVYKNIIGMWTQIGSDINGEATFDYSGYSVSLSADGTIVAIGAPFNNGNGSDSGQVRIYKNTAGIWTQIGTDIYGEAAVDRSGTSVSVSADGTTVAIGAQFNDGNGSDSGQVRIYKNTAGTWNQIGTDVNGEAAGDHCGSSISLSIDGNCIAIGADNNYGNGMGSGQVRIYKNSDGTWSQIGAEINGEAVGDSNGNSVSFSIDSRTIAIGARGNDGNGNDSGQVRIYDISALLASDSFVLTHFSIYPNPTSEMLNISLQDNLTLEKVNIYNALGQLVKTEKQNKINVNSLSKGSYFVEVITSEGKATKTIVVE